MDRVVYRQNKPKSDSVKRDLEIPKFLSGWFVQLALVIVSGILVFSVYKSIKITSQKLDILKQAQKEVEDLRLTNLSLSIEVQDMSTDKYLEKEARDRLNFGENGEMVFVLPQSSITLAKEQVDKLLNSDPELKEENESNVNTWASFIMDGI